MSSVPKVDLLNIRQLLKIYIKIKTNLSTVELRDSPARVSPRRST